MASEAVSKLAPQAQAAEGAEGAPPAAEALAAGVRETAVDPQSGPPAGELLQAARRSEEEDDEADEEEVEEEDEESGRDAAEGGKIDEARSKTNLYVDGLGQLPDEALMALFQPFGPIVRHTTIIDRRTGTRAGYGFVEFEHEADALRAMEALQGALIQGDTLRISFAKLKEGRRSGHPTNVYVQGVPTELSREQIESLFSRFGEVEECKVLRDKSGNSRGIAFARFASHDVARAAILQTNGTVLPGCTHPLVVKFARFKYAGVPSLTYEQQYALDAPPSVAFPQGAPIQMSPHALPHAAAAAASGDGGSSPFESPLIAAAAAAGAHPQAVPLFVFHVPAEATEEELRTLFECFGPVLHVAIARDRGTGSSKGFGFVTMASLSDAENAIHNLNGYKLGGKFLKVSFKKSRAASMPAVMPPPSLPPPAMPIPMMHVLHQVPHGYMAHHAAAAAALPQPPHPHQQGAPPQSPHLRSQPSAQPPLPQPPGPAAQPGPHMLAYPVMLPNGQLYGAPMARGALPAPHIVMSGPHMLPGAYVAHGSYAPLHFQQGAFPSPPHVPPQGGAPPPPPPPAHGPAGPVPYSAAARLATGLRKPR